MPICNHSEIKQFDICFVLKFETAADGNMNRAICRKYDDDTATDISGIEVLSYLA